MQNATFDINLELEVAESPKTEAWEEDDTTRENLEVENFTWEKQI